MTDQYPGDNATAGQILDLAGAYHDAAQRLWEDGCRKHTIARAPLHLAAIHAIELYLSALLLHKGTEAAKVRSLKHCLQDRADQAKQAGLQLRTNTHAHLVSMSDNREYLVVRYEPELQTVMSNITRLMATLNEVSKKVNLQMGDSKVRL
ncbi:MAG: hypothetical protein ABJM26_12615 [Anderseniella sp.]